MKTPKFYVHKSYNETSGGNHPDCLYGPFETEEDARYKVIELEPDLELDDDFDCVDYRYLICSTDDFPAEDQHGDLIDEALHRFYDFELDLSFGHARNVYARTIIKIGTLNHERVISLKIHKLGFDDLIKAQDTGDCVSDEAQIKLIFGDLLDLDGLDEDEIAELAVDVRYAASKQLIRVSDQV